MAQTAGKPENIPDKNMVRHMVINSLRGINLKFKEQYGTMILCADAGEVWRRDVFPNYKHSRRKGREASTTDWVNIFLVLSEIRKEIAENFPYVVLHIEKVEADDIIGTLVLNHTNTPIMIVSGDKDFIQLQTNSNVKQYAPIQKTFVGEGIDPKRFLHEQIIKGDRSDGIPNILSPDDVFLTGEKQRPINKKRLEEWSNVEKIPLGSETSKYFERNKTLIDLSNTPKALQETIINTYREYKIPNRSKLLPYFIQHKLKALMTNIGDF